MIMAKKNEDGEGKKNKNLSDEVRAKIDGTKDEAALNAIIADAAKYHAEMMTLKEGDGHLKELRDQVADANAQYAEEAKAYKATIKYAVLVAENRGYKPAIPLSLKQPSK
jgi:uncharacterized coiled-coil DUF342 family protein